MKHYCNVTFLSVGDTGPDGFPIEQLLRCSRCQETYYCGKEQQQKHWKIHKFVCRPAHADIQEEHHIANLGMLAAVDAFYRLFFNEPWVALASLIQRDNLSRRFLLFLTRMHDLGFGERPWVDGRGGAETRPRLVVAAAVPLQSLVLRGPTAPRKSSPIDWCSVLPIRNFRTEIDKSLLERTQCRAKDQR
jgi:hypothetical protein